MISIFQKIRITKSQRYLFNTKLKLFYAEVYLYLGYGIVWEMQIEVKQHFPMLVHVCVHVFTPPGLTQF